MKFQINNCTVGWGDNEPLLKNVEYEKSFSEYNQVLPIMGKSGVGKSTLLYLLSGLKELNGENASIRWLNASGEELIKFTCRSKTNEKNFVDLFAYAFQDAALLPFLTVKQNISMYVQKSGKTKIESDRIAEEQLSELFPGEDKSIGNKFPSMLSGGQKQRAALGKCIARSPKVIFADEPTGTLDSDTRESILDLIRQWLNKDCERVFIWVTHHQDEPSKMGSEKCLLITENGLKYISISEIGNGV